MSIFEDFSTLFSSEWIKGNQFVRGLLILTIPLSVVFVGISSYVVFMAISALAEFIGSLMTAIFRSL